MKTHARQIHLNKGVIPSAIIRAITYLPHALFDQLVFGQHSLVIPFQTILQRIIRGPSPAVLEFTESPVAGRVFHCNTAEKYFWEGLSYEEPLFADLRAAIRPSDVLYEIGAHAGFWVVLLSSICSRIYAFEPSANNYQRLLENISANRLNNVVTIQAAISESSGQVRFSDSSTTSHVSNQGTTVNAISLDDFIFSQGNPIPDVLLIDVEGHAGSVFRGAQQLLALKRTKIFCEIHNEDELNSAAAINGTIRKSRFPFRAVIT